MRETTASINERVENLHINYEGRKLIRRSIEKYDFVGSELYLLATISFGTFLFFGGGAVASATLLISETSITSSLQWYMLGTMIMFMGVVIATISMVDEIKKRRRDLLFELESYIDCTADNESRVLPYRTKES